MTKKTEIHDRLRALILAGECGPRPAEEPEHGAVEEGLATDAAARPLFAECLDYSKPPPGYVFAPRARDRVTPTPTARDVEMFWERYKRHNDPPGMYVDEIGVACEGLFGLLDGSGVVNNGIYMRGEAEARAAAWVHHDRRHALARHHDQTDLDGRFVSVDESPSWPAVLGWSDEQCEVSEAAIAAAIAAAAEQGPASLMTGECAACGTTTAIPPTFSIHRDGDFEGPEVPLCRACGLDESPTCEEIWAMIRARRQFGAAKMSEVSRG